MKRIVVKIGTNVLTDARGELDYDLIRSLVAQIVAIKKNHIDVVVVTSGAVAAGKGEYRAHDCVKKKDLLSKDKIAQRQVFASIGQTRLMDLYYRYFLENCFFCAQVLATKEDFRDREHFLNMHNCLEALLYNHIVPIINENDVISINELMFSDNDELAGLLSSMISADRLIILTNVDGLYNGDPASPAAQLIGEVKTGDKWRNFISAQKSSLGRGGMETKCAMAEKLAKIGIETIFTNGKNEQALARVMSGDYIGTRFVPAKKASGVKKWAAVSAGRGGRYAVLNAGATEAVRKGASVLLVGVVGIEGEFAKGDLIELKDEKGAVFGIGVARFASAEAQAKIGQKNEKPLVHLDSLFLY